MSTCRYALRLSALRRPAPIADGFALPWSMVVSGAMDRRKTCRIRDAAPRFSTTLDSLVTRSPTQTFVRPFKSP